MNNTDTKKTKWYIPVLVIAGGVLLGIIIAAVSFLYIRRKVYTSAYYVADNTGYSGNENGELLLPVQTDTAVKQAAETASASCLTLVNGSYNTYGVFEASSLGSGVVWQKEDGKYYIITNNHVVSTTKDCYVYLGEKQYVKCSVVGRDEEADLALITAPVSELPGYKTIAIGDSSTIKAGQTVLTIGTPSGVEFAGSVAVGVISSVNCTVTVEGLTNDYIQVDAAINPGNSGGALVNLDGELLGINSAKMTGTGVDSIGFSLPVNFVMETIETIKENGDITHLSIGVTKYSYLTKALAEAYNIPQGLVVQEVLSGSSAGNADIRKNDVIYKIDSTDISSAKDLRAALKGKKAGDTVEVTLIRKSAENRVITLKLVLMSEEEIAALQQTE